MAGLVGGTAKGGLIIVGSQFSESELFAAETLYERGFFVILREAPVGPATSRTSDLLINGIRYDVYTPNAGTSVKNILNRTASMWTQVRGGGVVIDLSRSGHTQAEFGDALASVNSFIMHYEVVMLVEGAAESILPPEVQVLEYVWVGDGLG